MNPVTGCPEAVWSYWDGADYEIAWSRFDGASWSMVATPSGPDFQFLTADQRQDLDPRLWIDAMGNRHVAWWRPGPQGIDEVVFTWLPAGETQWWLATRISQNGVSTSRPDIRTVWPYGTFIAAQEESVTGEVSAVVYEEPPMDPRRPPQRGSDPGAASPCAPPARSPTWACRSSRWALPRDRSRSSPGASPARCRAATSTPKPERGPRPSPRLCRRPGSAPRGPRLHRFQLLQIRNPFLICKVARRQSASSLDFRSLATERPGIASSRQDPEAPARSSMRQSY